MPRHKTKICDACNGSGDAPGRDLEVDDCKACGGSGTVLDPICAVIAEVERRRIDGIMVGIVVGAYATVYGVQGASDAFRSHLDSCAQCRHNPHNLCRIGGIRLERAAIGAAPTFATGKEI